MNADEENHRAYVLSRVWHKTETRTKDKILISISNSLILIQQFYFCLALLLSHCCDCRAEAAVKCFFWWQHDFLQSEQCGYLLRVITISVFLFGQVDFLQLKDKISCHDHKGRAPWFMNYGNTKTVAWIHRNIVYPWTKRKLDMQDRGQLWSPISAKYHLQSNTKEFFKTPLPSIGRSGHSNAFWA